MSLTSQIQQLAIRIAAEIRDVIRPKLVPPGGGINEVLRKTGNDDHQVGWIALHEVARTGDYQDLDNKPDLFSGSYDDLSDVPDEYDGGTF